MNRTYWALALDCNVTVLDSVYYAFDHRLNAQCPAYRFWTIVKTIDAVTQINGCVDALSFFDTQLIHKDNYQEVYAQLNYVTWKFPSAGALLVLEMAKNDFGFSLCWRRWLHGQYSQVLWIGRDQEWAERLVVVLHELQCK